MQFIRLRRKVHEVREVEAVGCQYHPEPLDRMALGFRLTDGWIGFLQYPSPPYLASFALFAVGNCIVQASQSMSNIPAKGRP
jgi:hypothetical protein